MSIGLEMLRAASAAPTLLRDASGQVVRFVLARQAPDGGFRGRGATSDLYYTVFAVEALGALGKPLEGETGERLLAYVRSFGVGEALDLVHLACLARLYGRLPPGAACRATDAETRRRILERIERHRSRDGGYADRPGAERGSAYGAFLAVAAREDLGAPGEAFPAEERDGIAASVEALRSSDGGFGNLPGARSGSTTAAAAATTVLRHLGRAVDPAAGRWLLGQCGPEGGFKAIPAAVVPDLLSTGTALHALRGMGIPTDEILERCLDFVESLWTPEGGFRGLWGDETPDCEYTYYGLLALGNLARGNLARGKREQGDQIGGDPVRRERV